MGLKLWEELTFVSEEHTLFRGSKLRGLPHFGNSPRVVRWNGIVDVDGRFVWGQLTCIQYEDRTIRLEAKFIQEQKKFLSFSQVPLM